jgi:hypothetical protein
MPIQQRPNPKRQFQGIEFMQLDEPGKRPAKATASKKQRVGKNKQAKKSRRRNR